MLDIRPLDGHAVLDVILAFLRHVSPFVAA